MNELGKEMNHLFAKMAANVIDDDAVEGDRHKATLRMIASVGLRPLEGESGQFEIFATQQPGQIHAANGDQWAHPEESWPCRSFLRYAR